MPDLAPMVLALLSTLATGGGGTGIERAPSQTVPPPAPAMAAARPVPPPPPAPMAVAQSPSGLGSSPNDGRWTIFPLITFAPETNLQLSAFVIYSFAVPPAANDIGAPPAPSPRSNVGLVAAYTLKNQFVVSLSPTLYLADGRWRVAGQTQALWFPDVFYEPGADSPAQSMETYTQRAFIGSAGVERRLFGRLRVGGQAVALTATMTRVEPGGRLAAGDLLGSQGGTGYGIGPLVTWDDRDREFNPQRGSRHLLSFTAFPRVANADFSFTQTTLDLRQYVPTWWAGHVVALQLYSQLSRGDIPFQLMPTLAGDSRMRGYFGSRYRDMHTVSGQIEYRATIWWRLGLVAFGGVGDVARRVAAFEVRHFRATAGGGVRVALDQKDGINLRLDVGH
ncbi:MAG: BamA/TamA family outer membrane protein, partial [Verrucomicrobiota bacterium]